VTGFVNYIAERLTPDVYVAMNDGMVCRMFMGTSGSHTMQMDRTRFKTFAAWFLGAKAYHRAMNLDAVVASVKKGNTVDPAVVREYLIYDSLQKFKAFLLDHEMVKAHRILLGLFNMQLPWLNHLGLNIVIFDWNNGGDVVVDCESVRQDASRFRLAAPFVFVLKHGPFYERIHHVQSTKKRVRSKPGAPTAQQGFVDRGLFWYGTTDRSFREVRAVVDVVTAGCKSGLDDVTATPSTSSASTSSASTSSASTYAERNACNSAGCLSRILRRGLHQTLRAQVLDYNFRLTGVITEDDVYVPLLVREAMLVGASAPPTVYIADIVDLRPKRSIDDIVAFFNTLAEITGDDRYVVSREERETNNKNKKGVTALVLGSGHVVPVYMKASDASGYLENLNVMTGARLSDDRRAYIERLSVDNKQREARRRDVSSRLSRDTDSQREFVFLRSAFNPFPFWYRRKRMRELLESLYRKKEVEVDGRLVDEMLHGPDLVREKNSGQRTVSGYRPHSSYTSAYSMRSMYGKLRTGRPGIARPDMFITEEDVASGAWLKTVEDIRMNPFSPKTPATISATTSDVVDATKSLEKVQREGSASLLRAWSACRTGSGIGSTPSSYSSSSPSSSTAFKKRLNRASFSSHSRVSRDGKPGLTIKQTSVIPSCDVWRLFHLVAALVTPGGRVVPLSSMRGVVANALLRLHAQPEHKGRLLASHPSLARHMKSVNNASTSTSTSTPTPFEIASMVQEVRVGSANGTYKAGLFDVAVLSDFCGIRTVVVEMPELSRAQTVRTRRREDAERIHVFDDWSKDGDKNKYKRGDRGQQRPRRRLTLHLNASFSEEKDAASTIGSFDLVSFDDKILRMEEGS